MRCTFVVVLGDDNYNENCGMWSHKFVHFFAKTAWALLLSNRPDVSPEFFFGHEADTNPARHEPRKRDQISTFAENYKTGIRSCQARCRHNVSSKSDAHIPASTYTLLPNSEDFSILLKIRSSKQNLLVMRIGEFLKNFLS